MLTYVGWRVICDSCGVIVELGGDQHSRAGFVEGGALRAIDLGWRYEYRTEHALTADTFAYWFCPQCLSKTKSRGSFDAKNG